MNERGLALLVVLWVLAGLGTAAGLGLGAVRQGIATSRVRVEGTRARWAADGCLVVLRARLDRALQDDRDPWREPARLVAEGCAVRLEPPGDLAQDANTASTAALAALPGFDAAVVEAVIAARAWGRRIESLDGLLAILPPALRERVATHYGALVGRIAFAPVAWDVVGVDDRARPVVTERWVLAGSRVAVVRRVLP
jgi:hypothetical protein